MPRRSDNRPGGSSYCHDWQYTICNDSTAASTSPAADASATASRHTRSHSSSGSGAGPSSGREIVCATPMMHGDRGSTAVMAFSEYDAHTSVCVVLGKAGAAGAAGGSLVAPVRGSLLGERLRPLFGVLAAEHHLRERRLDL